MSPSTPSHDRPVDLAVVGAGAAGLAAAIFAAESVRSSGFLVLLVDGAQRPGAKILVSGGGRCNVTHRDVTPNDFCGGSSHVVQKVLRAFDHHATVAWFERLGVALKCEDTGKLFPMTDDAHTVLSALLHRVDQLGIKRHFGHRVTDIRPSPTGFEITTSAGQTRDTLIRACRVIVATGGLALPKSGSDGAGLAILERLGHTIVPTTPALVPLTLKRSRSIAGRFTEFQGTALEARLRVTAGRATKPYAETEGAVLFTHFGLSGPAAMDLSRHWLRLKHDQPDADIHVTMGVREFVSIADADRHLTAAAQTHPRRHIETLLRNWWPSRIAEAVARDLGPETTLATLTREKRLHLATLLAAMPLEVTGTRGYSHAEATAGGVDLREVQWRTMASRRIPGLHLCGEILDVDGRIGGFNFQWAWSSGYCAGTGAVAQVG
ncbi:MAG TPA: NAD(P)/FAD-dependent oxidoreductase [candidate division Zixibacteria bacterium]|nr:NAD(P)/FAD-dependent oxidoreductase [candidate division Zixibacteria bacterium]